MYLIPDGAGAAKPEFMFNYGVGAESAWLHIPVVVVHPAKLPDKLATGLYLRVVDAAGETPLKAAVRTGVQLTVAQLQKIAADLKLKDIADGTGKGGRVIRADRIKQLVQHLFGGPGGKSQAELDEMIAKMLGKSAKAKSAQSLENERSVLEMCEQLDAENQQAFEQMKRWAKHKLENRLKQQGVHEGKRQAAKKPTFAQRLSRTRRLKSKGAGKGQQAPAPQPPAGGNAAPEAEGPLPHAAVPPGGRRAVQGRAIPERRPKVTPKEFKDLLPGRGRHASCFQPFRNDLPGNLYYRVQYKVSCLSACIGDVLGYNRH